MTSLRKILWGCAPLLAIALSACGSPSVPANACSTNNGGCDSHATCSDSGGVAVCTCTAPYTGDGKTCSMPNPCAGLSNGGCDKNATCTAEGQLAVCSCNMGYSGDGYHCTQNASCAQNNGGCDMNATCSQTGNGPVSCACNMNAGYYGDGHTCVACAANSCDPNATCSATSGMIVCTCNSGYVGDGKTCMPMDNCVPDPCGANATCVPTTTGDPMCMCDAGYMGDGKTCTLIPTCAMNHGGCDVHAACTDTPTGPTCKCKVPYSGPGTTCTPTDFCGTSGVMATDKCDANATCTNTPGSYTLPSDPGYTCACKTGFTGDGFTCQAIDHCMDQSPACDPNAKCMYTQPGQYQCTCNSGYTADGTGGSYCTKTNPYTYACTDSMGFTADDATCAPINACNPNPCGANSTCTSTGAGTYTCTCVTGYDNVGGSCVPHNKCMDTPGPCGQNSTCTFTGPNSYTCACNPGWTTNGSSCVPIDYCGTNGSPPTDKCDVNATCTDTVGSYTCACNAGFTGDGFHCQSHYLQVSVGVRHICGIRKDDGSSQDGTMWCWGWNNSGQFGNGSSNSLQPISTPQEVTSPTGSKWVYVAAGDDDTCGIQTDGSLWCWGDNTDGQIGTGSSQVNFLVPQRVGSNGVGWFSVTTFNHHTCALTRTGDVACWGLNNSGQLGSGDTVTYKVPNTVKNSMQNYQGSIAAGGSHTCGLQTGTMGTAVFCWGDNSVGQDAQTSATGWLDVPTQISAPQPTMSSADGTHPWLSVASGLSGSCGIQTDGSLWCWGSNVRGQLGNGTKTSIGGSFVPVPVTLLNGGTSTWSWVSLGDQFACGIQDGGTIQCWGDNSSSQLGGTSPTPYSAYPEPVFLPPNAQMVQFQTASTSAPPISSNSIYTCALDTQNELWCWGQPAMASEQIYSFGTTPTLISQ